MNPLLIILVLLLVFGGGGFYFGGPAIGGGGLGLILVVCLVDYVLNHESITHYPCSASRVRRRRFLLWRARHRRRRPRPNSGDMPCHIFSGGISSAGPVGD